MRKINPFCTLATTLVRNFSFSFNGVIWNTVAVQGSDILVLEVRDDARRQVSFSALNYRDKRFLWKDRTFEERWWAGLLAGQGSSLLLQQYDATGKLDGKTLLVYDLETLTLRWKREGFSYHTTGAHYVSGFIAAQQQPEPILLDLATGHELEGDGTEFEWEGDKIFEPLRPFQYQEGTPYFDTTSKFLEEHLQLTTVGCVEYQEYEGLIFISYYLRESTGLANYLLVLREDGVTLLHEKLDEQLKGLGVDTFFILSGCLFFVQNKRELLSYQIV